MNKMMNTVLTVGAILTGAVITTPAAANHNDYCREFNQKILINGEYERAYGKACLQPNGTWKIVSIDGDFDDNIQTSSYVIHRTYTHSSPFRIALYWGDGHRYHTRSYKHKHYYHGKKHHYKAHPHSRGHGKKRRGNKHH